MKATFWGQDASDHGAKHAQNTTKNVNKDVERPQLSGEVLAWLA